MDALQQTLHREHGDSINYLLMAERLEQQHNEDGDKALVWEAQGWVGYDLNRFWFKTEGHYNLDASETEVAEIQALYSKARSPLWDMQAGLRHDDYGDISRSYAVIGIQGLAPYWFETDVAAFVSEKGDVSARLGTEYELRLTQRLILQPAVELNLAFDDDPAIGVGSGLNDIEVGLRLRYEIWREFAPYLGFSWEKQFGETADYTEAAGSEAEELSVVAGIRFWY
jgi:copper resistance protein B